METREVTMKEAFDNLTVTETKKPEHKPRTFPKTTLFDALVAEKGEKAVKANIGYMKYMLAPNKKKRR